LLNIAWHTTQIGSEIPVSGTESWCVRNGILVCQERNPDKYL